VIDLCDLCYVRLGTRDLAGADHFVTELVGLQRCRDTGDSRSYRSDDRDHTLVYFEGDPRDQTVGFEVRSQAELAAARTILGDAGIESRWGTREDCALRSVDSFLTFRDPTGNSIDLAFRAGAASHDFVPTRDAGIIGLSHVGLRTTDAVRDERFWTDVLGARVSDRIGDAALLRIDEVHHKIALFPTTHAGLQHINHQVACIDDVMRSWYFLRKNGVPIVFGPGRHPTSGAVFLYFEGPDGVIFEYSTGVRTILTEEEATHRPRRFPASAESFCMWGAVPEIKEFAATDL
jgi:2,3-dihydroxy-p-cumate/2,3-dihydroxybenzoate 3,4-dioxygenase